MTRDGLREVARFVPDCAVLAARLLRDPRVPRRRKALLAVLAGYLALPFDLIPDFIPVLGQLDDALFVVLVLRRLVLADEELVREHWPGSDRGLDALLRVAGRA